MTDVTKITIVDDEESYITALKSILKSDNRNKVYNEFSNGNNFLKFILNSPFKPNICLIDVVLPDMNGIECAKIVKSKFPDIRIILMSAYPDKVSFMECEKIGLDFIEKGTLGEIIIDKIVSLRKDKKDQLFFSFNIQEGKFNRDESDISILLKIKEIKEKLTLLSQTQREVLKLKQNGKTIDEIASILGKSPHTIQTHCKRISKKLNLPSILDFLDL